MNQLKNALLFLVPFLAGVFVGPTVFGGTAMSSQVIPTLPPTPSATSSPTPSHTVTPVDTATPTLTPTYTTTSSPTPTLTPTATVTPERRASVMEDATLLAIYGRGFGIAPILGLLGQYKTFDDMQRDIERRFYPGIRASNDGKKIVPVVHLIYALATSPCAATSQCLFYLDDAEIDIVKTYIEPAGRRGWEIILDSQIGRSDPVAQVRRMIDRGYLKYEHVHVALDPEFHAYPNRTTPGVPVGVLQASAINDAQVLLDDYILKQGLKRKKMLMLHQFGDPEVDDGVPFMIQNKKTIRTFPTIDLVWDADGFGGPDSKASKYNRMTSPVPYPFIQWRAIKLFTENKEAPKHYDIPLLEWSAVFGKKDTPGGIRIRYAPNVVVIA